MQNTMQNISRRIPCRVSCRIICRIPCRIICGIPYRILCRIPCRILCIPCRVPCGKLYRIPCGILCRILYHAEYYAYHAEYHAENYTEYHAEYYAEYYTMQNTMQNRTRMQNTRLCMKSCGILSRILWWIPCRLSCTIIPCRTGYVKNIMIHEHHAEYHSLYRATAVKHVVRIGLQLNASNVQQITILRVLTFVSSLENSSGDPQI